MRFLNLNDLEEVGLIMSACVTHNICIIRADLLEDFVEDEPDGPAVAGMRIIENNAEGALKRDAIAHTLPLQ